VSFTSTTPAICTVAGTSVTLIAAGACTLVASQAGDDAFLAAPDVIRSMGLLPVVLHAPEFASFAEGAAAATVGESKASAWFPLISR
jgi:hypothetical protein